ncbi:MAG: hypothetical protein U5R14_15025 [Gemmatimonadota bacterium]|nr:hypothetical protein [Gemmatimonadota bacterium]
MSTPVPESGAASTPAEELARALVRASDGTVRAILLYGSHLLRSAAPDRHSAVDLVVVVDDYRAFHRALSAAGELPRPPWLMSALAHVLPPNVIAFAPEEGRAAIAKCLVVRSDHFERALGPNPPDHFLLGRLVQKVAVTWARTEADARWVDERIRAAHRGVLRWMAPYLEASFDAQALGRRMLEVCYRGELRPEAGDRAEQIFQAQAPHFERAFGPVLEEAEQEGIVRPSGEGYCLRTAPGRRDARRWRRHFRRSKLRATLRWLKHTVTFANWLPYVVRKVERHTGREIHLTPLERKLPLLFLWPRAVYVLCTRPSRRDS